MDCRTTWPSPPILTSNDRQPHLTIELDVNGRQQRLAVRAQDRLSSVLRGELGLTGLKEGCLEGECGACTVLLDGKPVNACLVLAFQAEGQKITTVEGLESEDGTLSDLQQAFLAAGAVQCGYCTPGMLVAAQGLLRETPHPGEDEIREALGGNQCRCTGFQSIVDAVKSVAAR